MRHLLFAFLVSIAFSAKAVEDNETRIRQLEEKLRCLVCQNQTLADSSAELASDLRKQVRDQVAAGRSDEEIIRFLVQRYGDFVLYEPPFKATTALLWLGPPLLILSGGFVFWRVVRRKRAQAAAAPVARERRREIEQLLEKE